MAKTGKSAHQDFAALPNLYQAGKGIAMPGDGLATHHNPVRRSNLVKKNSTGSVSGLTDRGIPQPAAIPLQPPAPMLLLVLSTIFKLAASLQKVPGCLSGEQATLTSQTRYVVPDLLFPPKSDGIPLTNATATFFTCPSREAQGDAPLSTPIDLHGPFNNRIFFEEGTFNCTQGATDQPTIKDCSRMDDAVVDSKPTQIIIPPHAGVVLSLNDDTSDTYDTCVGAISSFYPIIIIDSDGLCPQAQDGFLGSYRPAIQPGIQNWEWQCVAAPLLSDFQGTENHSAWRLRLRWTSTRRLEPRADLKAEGKKNRDQFAQSAVRPLYSKTKVVASSMVHMAMISND
ncbi:hypothetical protein B0H13DRAFT_1860581 [Mycena leptocephala]|nr:hypothetical protein B0H13DRAFT_1860581 [Mycena leptocephala]